MFYGLKNSLHRLDYASLLCPLFRSAVRVLDDAEDSPIDDNEGESDQFMSTVVIICNF